MSLTDTRNSHNSIAKKKNPINLIKISQRTWIEFLWRGNTKVQKKVINITNHLCVCVCVCVHAHSVKSNTLQPHGLWPARLLCPWDFPGKNIGVDCLFLLTTLEKHKSKSQWDYHFTPLVCLLSRKTRDNQLSNPI